VGDPAANPGCRRRPGGGRSDDDVELKLLYVAGYSRSGSTLVDLMVGQLPGMVSTGEFAYLWTHALQQNRLCGCGVRFSQCAFWRRVGQEAFGGWDRIDVQAMRTLEQRVNRHRYLPLLLFPTLWPPFKRELREYAEILARLYRAIATVGGARLIVDSSIDPAYGYLLRHVRGLDVRVLHLVRDSRGTAFSWTRQVKRTDRPDANVQMPRFSPPITAVRWVLYHLSVLLLRPLVSHSMFLRYEDFVRAPRRSIERILDCVEEPIDPAADLAFIGDGEVTLGANHTPAGNRLRLRSGTIAVHVDDEWRRSMSAGARRLVTLMSWPLLWGFGYLRPGRKELRLEPERLKVALVCSSGGHLLQLYQLKPWWQKHDRFWATFHLPDAQSMLDDEKVVWAHHPTTRNVGNMLRNARLAWRVLRVERPQVVVSNGAGIAFPFFVVARLLGIKTVYVEVYDRIDSPTLTGRLCRPFANLFLLQWDDQKRFYPRGRVIGGLL